MLINYSKDSKYVSQSIDSLYELPRKDWYSVTMLVSLRTQTVLCHLIIQVLNTRVSLLYTII